MLVPLRETFPLNGPFESKVRSALLCIKTSDSFMKVCDADETMAFIEKAILRCDIDPTFSGFDEWISTTCDDGC